jgi:hypothetical protein
LIGNVDATCVPRAKNASLSISPAVALMDVIPDGARRDIVIAVVYKNRRGWAIAGETR